jgi:DNA-binding transcriptional regulator YiaG
MSKFAEKVAKFIKNNKSEGLAKEFEVATSTVNRWARGAARPHPRISAQILAYIKENSNE